MPVYTYECRNCDKKINKMSPMDKRDEQVCDVCSTDLERKIVFTGSVWSPTRNGGMS